MRELPVARLRPIQVSAIGLDKLDDLTHRHSVASAESMTSAEKTNGNTSVASAARRSEPPPKHSEPGSN
jgi:hypothetical protein